MAAGRTNRSRQSPTKSIDLPACTTISTVKRPDGLSADLPDLSVRSSGPSAVQADRQDGLYPVSAGRQA